ncbi:MAG: rhodanese [Owenweeksia sp.]|nr:rhodanese [Owenweeksia sp.]MBG00205.1 rhodanese [Owenweeksia sp.]HBF19921.1 rhodanese-like domain-containing protein [Cryomorphaceae bacterium]HCQ14674.1 rhodanese-like domain-containing protein [Cryomorphaceae bacterium]
MKKLSFATFVFLTINACTMAQEPRVESKAYDAMLKTLLSHSVKEVSVKEAAAISNAVFIDTREKQEYNVSHLKNAVWVGYDDFEMSRVAGISKQSKIVVYCSVGARSEKVSLKLKEAGYEDVSNLYGGIFEWVNQEQPVYNDSGKTNKIHPYNRLWGVWLTEGEKDKGE